MNRNVQHLSLAIAALSALALLVTSAPRAMAHETDQYTLPHGRQFADLGPYLNAWFYDRIEAGVSKINQKIAAAVRKGDREEVKQLHSDDEVVKAVNGSFPNAYDVIEGLNSMFRSSAARNEYPGLIVGYHEQFSNIYESAHFVLDPRQFFRIWHAGTLCAWGTYLGADKIGHFTDMGRHYWNAYSDARKKGATDEEATAEAIKVGTSGAIFAETGMLGYLSAGAYSNGDNAANYLGFLFYRNLTAPVMLKGLQISPMLVLEGDYWVIAPHVKRDNDFFAMFIGEHMNEVLNPSHYESSMRGKIREAIKERQWIILERYADANGLRRPMGWFQTQARDCRTYFGAAYGHNGPADELLTPANVCFDALPADASPNDRNDRGYTPLHDAVIRGELERLRSLLAAGADVNAPIRSNEPYSSEWGATPLHLAARDGRAEIVDLLLEAGARVDAQDDRGATALHWSAGQPGVAAALIERGANANAADRAGRTPLHWAANLGAAESIDALIKRGATANLADAAGRTPLHLAAANGDARTVARMLENGADESATDRERLTPLHLAARNGNVETVTRLQEESAGAIVNARDAFGCTPLHEAARTGRAGAVDALLAKGADVNAADIAGSTAMHLAARQRHDTSLRLLIARGGNIDARNVNQATPLHEAAFAGLSDAIAALTDAGADLLARDALGRTPRDVALGAGHRSVLAMLVPTSAEPSAVAAGAR
jgi:ankyrin repeat protein